jgi:hypothetical protein
LFKVSKAFVISVNYGSAFTCSASTCGAFTFASTCGASTCGSTCGFVNSRSSTINFSLSRVGAGPSIVRE